MGRHHETAKLVIVALLAAGAAVAAPAAARQVTDALNADRVDGFHAVKSGTAVARRRGKLVATSKKGFLPNNIIKTAPNAKKLGGVPARGYARVDKPLVLTQVDPWDVTTGTAYDPGIGATGNQRSGSNGQLFMNQFLHTPLSIFGRTAALVAVEVCYDASLGVGNDPTPQLNIRVSTNLQQGGVFSNSTTVHEKLDTPRPYNCETVTLPTPFTPSAGQPLYVTLYTNNVGTGSNIIAGRITATWVAS